jgi:hypothetical protein
MQFKFEKLIIWQKAMEYGESIFLKKNSENFRLPTSDFRLIRTNCSNITKMNNLV